MSQATSYSLINLGDHSKPANTLLKKITSAVLRIGDRDGRDALGGGRHWNSSAWVPTRTKLIEPPGPAESST